MILARLPVISPLNWLVNLYYHTEVTFFAGMVMIGGGILSMFVFATIGPLSKRLEGKPLSRNLSFLYGENRGLASILC